MRSIRFSRETSFKYAVCDSYTSSVSHTLDSILMYRKNYVGFADKLLPSPLEGKP